MLDAGDADAPSCGDARSMSSRPQRRVLVTGSASGIGRETARELARRGDHLIVVDRSAEDGRATASCITREGGSAEFRELDLADLGAIRRFAAEEIARGAALDVLINNAGILPPLERSTTKDGFELEFGIAHLGHFALTGLLLPALARSGAPRVVSVSSNIHPGGRIDFADLHYERRYGFWRVYTATKLACLMFAFELHRRASAAGCRLISVAAHPGVSKTSLAAGWEREARRGLHSRLELVSQHLSMRLLGQSAADGARSLVYAASETSVVGGGYYGPTGRWQIAGPPGPVRPSRRALDTATAARLWNASEELTGVRYQIG